MENVKYVVLLYKYDVVEVGDLFVILHIYNKILSYKKKDFSLQVFPLAGRLVPLKN